MTGGNGIGLHRDAVWPLLLAALFLAVSFAVVDVWAGEEGSDIAVYARYGDEIMQGAVPYRDLRIEYPPGSLGMIVPPAVLAQDASRYGDAFVLLAGFFLIVTLLVTWWSLVSFGDRGIGLLGRLLPVACVLYLLGPIAAQRLDPLPAMLVSVVLLLTVGERLIAGSFVAGVAVATKLYPAVLMPSVLKRSHRLGGPTAVVRTLAWFVLGVALVVFPFALLGGADGLLDVLRYHLQRPLHMETVGASGALFLHVVAGFDVGLSSGYGSMNLGGARGEAIDALQAVALLVALAWVAFRTAQIGGSRSGAVLASAASLTTLLALGKVLSPQYLVWLLPAVPLVRGRLGLIATVWLMITCFMTQVWYERYYVPVVRALDSFGILVLVARNAMLLVLLVLLIYGMEREASGMRARRPKVQAAAGGGRLVAPSGDET